MIFYALSILSFITSILCSTEEFILPVSTCKRNSTDYTTCLKVALQESWPRFVKGLPEIDFPHLDPFEYKYGKLVLNANEIYGHLEAKNITVFGLTTTRFLDVRPQFLDDVFRIEIDVYTPRVLVHMYFAGEGNILGVRMSGSGQENLTLTGNRATWNIIGHVKNDTWTIEHFQITLIIDALKTQLDLLDIDKELTNLLEALINNFWPPIYRVAAPRIFQILDPTFTDLANRVFSKVSFSKIFP